MRDTDEDWNIIAGNEPYYGVLSNERFLLRNMDDEGFKAFFQSGERDIEHIFAVLQSLRPDFNPAAALDFGCGVGRLLAPICKRVSQAYGVDIADGMLSHSRANLEKMGFINFYLSPTIPEAPLDWVNSWIVFQHIPPVRGYDIIKQLWSKLSEGGGFSIHFTIYRDFRHLQEILRDVRACTYDGDLINLLEQNDNSHPGAMTMYDYDFSKVLSSLNLRDGQRFVVEHTDHGGCHGLRLYLVK